MSDYTHLMWAREGALLKTFATASGVKATKVTIVLEVKDGYALSDILRQCHDAQVEGRLGPEKPQPSNRKPKKAEDEPLALPAPHLQLPYFGEDR